MNLRTFSDLRRLPTFRERFDYLSLQGVVGESTFGFERWMNQDFYRSREWKSIRRDVIARDQGCDLAAPGHEIYDRIIVHHMNPMRAQDLVHGSMDILDLEYLISTTHQTHNAIHYGDARQLRQEYVPRTAGDTKLW